MMYKRGDYSIFLKDMKNRISDLKYQDLEGLLVKLKPLEIEGVKKTIPKIIDEYNFVTITKKIDLHELRGIINTIF